jgi:hypothetical protein
MQQSSNANTVPIFLSLSAVFWTLVVAATLFWGNAYGFMEAIITMRSEYTLLEQGTKLLLLVMFFGALIAFNREGVREQIILAIGFILFSLALYFAESNFITEILQPVVGAVLILGTSWLLLKIDRIALTIMLTGCLVVFLGVVSDILLDHPDFLPSWDFFKTWQSVASDVEEDFDLWGIAFISYSCLVVFRRSIIQVYRESPLNFIVLVVAASCIAAGNSFAHWQYRPTSSFELIATALSFLGVTGVLWFYYDACRKEPVFIYFSAKELFSILVLLFVVLPIIYGGTSVPLNLIFGTAFFYVTFQYLCNKRRGICALVT